MLFILFSRVAVAAAYVAGLLATGALDVLAVTAGLAAVTAWLGRPAIRAFAHRPAATEH
jgi:hypothetical protein